MMSTMSWSVTSGSAIAPDQCYASHQYSAIGMNWRNEVSQQPTVHGAAAMMAHRARIKRYITDQFAFIRAMGYTSPFGNEYGGAAQTTSHNPVAPMPWLPTTDHLPSPAWTMGRTAMCCGTPLTQGPTAPAIPPHSPMFFAAAAAPCASDTSLTSSLGSLPYPHSTMTPAQQQPGFGMGFPHANVPLPDCSLLDAFPRQHPEASHGLIGLPLAAEIPPDPEFESGIADSDRVEDEVSACLANEDSAYSADFSPPSTSTASKASVSGMNDIELPHSPGQPIRGVPCEHLTSWKRLRAKKGFGHFVCKLCGAHWRKPKGVPSIALMVTKPAEAQE